MEKPKFLENKYPDLPGSKPVERAVQKAKRSGEKSPHGKSERLEAYLSRLAILVKDERAFGLLKYKILEKYTTKEKDIPESYWKLQERIMRERGQLGDWESATTEQKEDMKRQNSEGVLSDQRSSLEQWVDYFASSDSEYMPNDLKYWVFRNIIGLQEFDKDKKEFPKRSKGTVKQFPDINHEALAYVIDAVIKKLNDQNIEFEYDIQPEERQSFETFLAKEDFGKLYSWANELMNPIPEHLLPVTAGEWRKYEQNSDHAELVKGIRGKGTGWCTAGENTAHKQLEGGDFHIFYSLDDNQQPTIPRIAIRMEEGKIAEVRGVAHKQNLDPYMSDVLEKKLNEFPNKEQYLKKDSDMKLLTEIENKIKNKETISKDNLLFLYEINEPINGFGYQKDPRIQELRAQRNIREDASIILERDQQEIATNKSEITENTKVYVGELFPGIFERDFEHISTSIFESKVEKYQIQTGGKSKDELKRELENQNISFGENAKRLFESRDFVASEKVGSTDLVVLQIKDLGLGDAATSDVIYKRALELGLELCPAEFGAYLPLERMNQPMDSHLRIAMKEILVSTSGFEEDTEFVVVNDRSGSDFCLEVFAVWRDKDGKYTLSSDVVEKGHALNTNGKIVFRIRSREATSVVL